MLFDLKGLDATDPELRRYSRYFIGSNGLRKVFHSLLPVPEGGFSWQNLEDHAEEIGKDMRFALDRDLDAPTEEDILAMHGILWRADMDGLIRVAD
jgi:hypothetical protein